jgi:hypothetical protein
MTEPSELESRVDWFLKPDLFSYPKFADSVCKSLFIAVEAKQKLMSLRKSNEHQIIERSLCGSPSIYKRVNDRPQVI